MTTSADRIDDAVLALLLLDLHDGDRVRQGAPSTAWLRRFRRP
jgi:hypothetical protein